MNLPIEYNEFNRIDVENPGLEETPEAPNQRPCLNNQKFNSNLVSFTVLTLLFVITLIVGPIYGWHIFISSTVPQFISYRTLNTWKRLQYCYLRACKTLFQNMKIKQTGILSITINTSLKSFCLFLNLGKVFTKWWNATKYFCRFIPNCQLIIVYSSQII